MMENCRCCNQNTRIMKDDENYQYDQVGHGQLFSSQNSIDRVLLFYYKGGTELNYQDYRQTLNRRLNDKVQQELSDFRKEMLNKSPQEIFNAAYQIFIKNDIAECIINTDYSPQAVRALLKSPDLLQEIYEEWIETDYSHMENLRQTITDFKSYMVKTEKLLSGKER